MSKENKVYQLIKQERLTKKSAKAEVASRNEPFQVTARTVAPSPDTTIKSLSTEKAFLQKELKSLQASVKRLETYKSRYEESQEEIVSLKEDIAGFQNLMDEKDFAITTVKGRISELEKTINRLEKSLQKESEEKKVVMESLSSEKQSHLDTKQKLSDETERHLRAINELTAAVKSQSREIYQLNESLRQQSIDNLFADVNISEYDSEENMLKGLYSLPSSNHEDIEDLNILSIYTQFKPTRPISWLSRIIRRVRRSPVNHHGIVFHDSDGVLKFAEAIETGVTVTDLAKKMATWKRHGDIVVRHQVAVDKISPRMSAHERIKKTIGIRYGFLVLLKFLFATIMRRPLRDKLSAEAKRFVCSQYVMYVLGDPEFSKFSPKEVWDYPNQAKFLLKF